MEKHVVRLKIAVLAYFEKDGKILLQKRKNTGWRDGWYGFVSGHAEQGESFTQALCREVAEEAGVKVLEDDLEFGNLLQLSSRISDMDRVFIYYKVRKWEGDPHNTEPEKCDEIGWFDIESLPENTIPIVRFGMDEMLKGVKYSSFGWKEEEKDRV